MDWRCVWLSLCLGLASAQPEPCVFPEQGLHSFFFDVQAGTPARSVIVDTVVEPADADLSVLSIQSNNIKTDLSDTFELEQHQNGQFLLLSTESLVLPPYPSSVNQTMLYVTVKCNGKPYPLFTVRVKNFNTYAPEFLNMPSEIFVANDAPVGTEIDTKVLAIDRDPAPEYTVTYKIENQHQQEIDIYVSPDELIDLNSLPPPFSAKRYARTQIPHKIKMRVISRLTRPVYYVNITAMDNQKPAKSSSVLLKIIVGDPREAQPHFSQPLYYGNLTRGSISDSEVILNQPIMAIFPDRGSLARESVVKYEIVPSEDSQKFRIDADTARIFFSAPSFTLIPETIELTVKAYLESDPSIFVTTKVAVVDSSEVKLTYFSQCRYSVHLAENTPSNTRVMQFQIDGIDLLNGTDYFDVTPDGSMVVKPEVQIDREQVEGFVLIARLRSTSPLHPKSLELCQIATVEIQVDDVNDNSPHFAKNQYTFRIDEQPYNNTEVGVIKAADQDAGPFGKVKYRLLDDTIPFILFQADGMATIYYVTQNHKTEPEHEYSFTVEAYDAEEYPRTDRVTVRVFIGPTSEEVEVVTLPEDPELYSVPTTKQEVDLNSFRTHGARTLDGAADEDEQLKNRKFEFGQEQYTFNLTGKIDVGEYIGTVRLAEDAPDVDYEVEEGIRGFVSMDVKYGTLRVGRKLTEDEYEQIRFAATAKTRRGHLLATTLITVYVDEHASEYALTPQFEQAIYRFQVEENQPEQSLAQIEAHHRAVELGKDNVWYTLDRTPDAKFFKIDPESGWLASKKAMDYEDKKLYNLRINGCLGSNTKLCGHAEAVVVVQDMNDNEPAFDKSAYQVEIPADLSVGTEVLQVHAEDKDQGENAKVRYQLNSDANIYAQFFEIDEQSGELKLAKPLGRDLTDMSFYVTARDMGQPPLMVRAQVKVTVLNNGFSNTNAPEFDDFRYEVSMKAPIPAGTVIGEVRAVDPDPGLDGLVWYKLESDSSSKKFEIDRSTGQIRTTSSVGTSDGELIQLTVNAYDSAPQFPRKSVTVFMIHLTEDHEALQFLPLPKTVYISTSKPVGSTIFKAALKNGDVSGVKYTVEQDPRNQLFGMLEDNLIVLLRLKPGIFRISIRAFVPETNQSTSHSLKMVVMTDRDKYPVFDKLSYDLKVPADSAFPVKLPPFSVSLRQGSVAYSIYNPNEADAPQGVKIDRITGELTVFEEFVRFSELELSRPESFLVVRATNEQYPEFYSDVGVTLTLKHSANELQFTSKLYRLITRENAPAGSVINSVHIGVQQPGLFPKLQLSIEPAHLFAINGNGQVALKKTIDLEELPPEANGIIEATVTASDTGRRASVPVQIKVEDENEYAPKFEQDKYSFAVDPAVRKGSVLGQVSAIDRDFLDQNKVVYSAELGSALGFVEVRQDGQLVKANDDKFEPGSHYNLIVMASDPRGKKTETVILFDINEESPVITPISEREHVEHHNEEWKPKGTEDEMMISSMPRGDWDFKIVKGNEEHHYEIAKVNKSMAKLGLVKAMVEGMSSKKSKEFILVEATNLDDPFDKVETNVSVDLKALKKKLEFDKSASDEILVNLASTTQREPIYKVRVKGPSDIRYNIDSQAQSDFRIDEVTGEIFLNKPKEEIQPGNRSIQITVGDNNNSIQKSFTVILVGIDTTTQRILTSTASINVESAEQTDAEAVTVDQLSQDLMNEGESIQPSTSASEGRSQTPTAVDGEDAVVRPSPGSRPAGFGFSQAKYKFEIRNPKANDVIGRMDVFSEGPVKMNIIPEQYKQWFGVDPKASTLYVRQVPEGLSGRQRAEFTVVAQDASRAKAETKVKVDLVLNDKSGEAKPSEGQGVESAIDGIFQSTQSTELGSLETGVDEAESVPSTTGRTLPQTTRGPQLEITPQRIIPEIVGPTHKIVPQVLTTSKPAKASPSTAETTTADGAPFENTPNFDENPAPTEELPFQPDADMDSGSLFKHRKYTAVLPEGNYGTRGVLVNLKPSPLKSGLEDVLFEIDSTASSLPFYVRNNTGELIAFANIDREETTEYKFNVIARSLSPSGLSDVAEIKIKVLDVNDNYPSFVDPIHALGVDINQAPNKVLAVFRALDKDQGQAGKVTYRLADNFNGLFDINSSGELSLTTKISALPSDSLNLQVVALDGGRPALKSPLQVRVDFFDGASDQPEFKKDKVEVTLSKDVQAGDYVYQVVGGVNHISYEISDDPSDLFNVDKSTGVLTLSRKPVADEQNGYHFVNISATSESGKTASMVLNMLVEGEQSAATSAPTIDLRKCRFTQKIYNAEVKENTPGKTKLVTVASDCGKQGRPVEFSIHQAAEFFEIDSKTGEVFVNGPLDREQKSIHFIVVNITEVVRGSRQSNPVVDYAKKKLTEDQAMVSVKVLDENDNEPIFANKNSEGDLVAVVDWQAPLLQPVVRVVAQDADEKNKLTYSMDSTDYFSINQTNGLVFLTKTLVNSHEEVFDLEARVNDGVHKVKAPLRIYKLAPGTNIVFLGLNKPETEVDEQQVARKLSTITGKDARILVKQIFINEEGHALLNQTHLFVYALDKATKAPIPAAQFKSLLDKNRLRLEDADLDLITIQLPVVSNRLVFSWTEAIMLGLSVFLLLMACLMLAACLRCLKRRSVHVNKTDLEYMVDAQAAGPKPYNVELISRKTAQDVLTSRPLPEAVEENTMSAESRASMIASSGVAMPDSTRLTPMSTVTDDLPPSPHSNPPHV